MDERETSTQARRMLDALRAALRCPVCGRPGRLTDSAAVACSCGMRWTLVQEMTT